MAKEPETFSFYRPHKRVQEDGRMVNHVTGEITYPPSMTKQEFVAECDINNINKAFAATGQINHLNARAAQGAFEDLPDEMDLQLSLDIIHQAETAFMELPAKTREKFHQQPGEFLAFMADPANEKEAREMGLLKPLPRPPEPIEVKVVPPAPAPAKPPEKAS